MKLNIGCGRELLGDYLNIDVVPPADYCCDIRSTNFKGIDEICMIHSLEHIPYRDVPVLLTRMRRWLVPDGVLRIEVPDMQEICKDPTHPNFLVYTYGIQTSGGEIHMSGFTLSSLMALLMDAGFYVETGRVFRSTHHQRIGMPCLEVIAHAPRSLLQEPVERLELTSSEPFAAPTILSVS
jgi:predicted SAM-dependent methyltransferase